MSYPDIMHCYFTAKYYLRFHFNINSYLKYSSSEDHSQTNAPFDRVVGRFGYPLTLRPDCLLFNKTCWVALIFLRFKGSRRFSLLVCGSTTAEDVFVFVEDCFDLPRCFCCTPAVLARTAGRGSGWESDSLIVGVPRRSLVLLFGRKIAKGSSASILSLSLFELDSMVVAENISSNSWSVTLEVGQLLCEMAGSKSAGRQGVADRLGLVLSVSYSTLVVIGITISFWGKFWGAPSQESNRGSFCEKANIGGPVNV